MELKRSIALPSMLALLVTACAGAATPAPTAAPTAVPTAAPTAVPTAAGPVTPAPAAKCSNQKVSFELSFIPNVQHAGFLVASKRGYYTAEGLDVTIKPGSPTTNTGQDVANGTADMGQVDYVAILQARAAGVPIKVVAQTYKLPFFFWYALKSKGITTMEQWKGKKVGAVQTGDYPERDAMLIAAKLNPKSDITVVQTDFGTTDFMAGKVDIGEGVVFYHPAYLIGVDKKSFPGDFDIFEPAKLGANFASQTVAASEAFLAKDPAAVRCFLRASIRGWQATFMNPQAAVDDVMTFIPPGAIPKEHQQGAINSVLPIVGSGANDPSLLQTTPDRYLATMNQLKTLGYLKSDVDVPKSYDASFFNTMGPVPAP